ncbi:MAG: serine/threonine-protein kinase [Armatimonadetes bacterium]|nr:serine/threonine-protein kinase [Armatimonadota bacterium]
MSASPWQLLQGQVVDGRYHLVEMLGSGGFGAVFRAEEVVADRLLRQVAVKLIPPSPELDPERQFQEIELSVRLSHPNILTCYSAGRCNLAGIDYLFLAMELADESLERHLSRNGRLSDSDAAELARQVASAIAYLHGSGVGIVHRDITPGNVLMVNGQWKLSDFGISRLLGSSGPVYSRALGGPGYVPPEGYSGQVTTAWDIWSFGVLICRALTGEPPFSASSDEEMMRAVIDGQPIIPSGVGEPFISVIRGCLSKDRKSRWTAQQVLSTLGSSVPRSRTNVSRTIHVDSRPPASPSSEQDAQAMPRQRRQETPSHHRPLPTDLGLRAIALSFVCVALLAAFLIWSRYGSGPGRDQMAKTNWTHGQFLIRTDKGWKSCSIPTPLSSFAQLGVDLRYSALQWGTETHTYHSPDYDIYAFVRGGMVEGVYSGKGHISLGYDGHSLGGFIMRTYHCRTEFIKNGSIEFDTLELIGGKQFSRIRQLKKGRIEGVALECRGGAEEDFMNYYGPYLESP